MNNMNTFKDLDKELQSIRKRSNNLFIMEAKSEKEIMQFYNEHTDLDDNDLAKRLSYLKKYDDKFKTCILPIMIAIVFGIVVAIAMAAISYQKASTVDVMYEAWEDASAKIPMTEENKDMYAEIYKDYQHNVRLLYCILFVFAIVVILGVLAFIALFDLWYDSRLHKSYQKNLEVDYLEPELKKRRAEYIKSLKK